MRLLSYLTKGVPRRAVARNLKTFPRSLFSPDGKRGEEREERSSDNVSWCSVPLSHTLEGRKEGRKGGDVHLMSSPSSIDLQCIDYPSEDAVDNVTSSEY